MQNWFLKRVVNLKIVLHPTYVLCSFSSYYLGPLGLDKTMHTNDKHLKLDLHAALFREPHHGQGMHLIS